MSESAQNATGIASTTTEPSAGAEPDVGLVRVLRDDDAADYGTRTPIDAQVLFRAYREMRRLRAIDARMIVLQRQGRVGFYGACTGQEAVPIATGLALEKTDWVFPALREQSVMLVRGFPLIAFVAQVFGNAGDVLKGRQMPSHHSGRSVNQVSWSSNIGTQIPQAVGAAWAMKMKKAPHIAVGFMGDGATSEADFHAAMTFAARYRVPAVLVCQNNHWSISVPTERQTASRTIAIKGRAYGIPAVRIDGNDLLAVYTVVREASERARAGEGPTFIEALTYRIGAHSTSDDPTRYRSDAEVEAWKKKDPLDRLRRHLVHLGVVDARIDEQLDAEFTHEIGEAVRDVEAMPAPARATLFEDVYAVPPWNLVEQREST
ncbi:thiamine pyrophosphate-dependent dehydrogenase E1 component subunit alpha [Pendulispora albinea]|uniref:2-oxoisovalerate dehydrogenase subunit alpha n=1 Tax=Pendulispora albinea TaxID=2741071 RepID=A0ABZ2M8P3_9BACT